MVEIFSQWIATHKAVSAWFHAAHHVTKGTGFGGDHANIYGRIYTELEADFDEIVEKGLGLTGDETLADPVSILSTASNHLAQYPQPTNQDAELIARNALEVARAYIAFIESIYAQFNSSGTMSLGLDDQLQGFANKYETYVYLLQQRSKIISNGMAPMMETKMRLTKRQLKQIIREEYTQAKRKRLLREGYPKNVQAFYDKITQYFVDKEMLSYDGTKLPDGESLTVEESRDGYAIKYGNSIQALFDKKGQVKKVAPEFKDKLQSYLEESRNLKITKGQLKKIIREEYSRLKRQGLIKEMGHLGINRWQ